MVSAHIRVCVYTCIYIYTYIYVCVVHICIYIYIYMHTYIHTCIYSYVYVSIYIYICVYMHIYICVYMKARLCAKSWAMTPVVTVVPLAPSEAGAVQPPARGEPQAGFTRQGCSIYLEEPQELSILWSRIRNA